MDAARKVAAPSGTTCDTDAPIKIQTVAQGRCRCVRPITSCPFGIDQDRDGGRGVRLTSDLRGPESAVRSTRFHGAEPGHNAILEAQDGFFALWTTNESSGAPQRERGRQNPHRVQLAGI